MPDSSVNGDKNGNQLWNLNDEIEDCAAQPTVPESKLSARPRTFCKDITMLQNLTISGDVVIGGNVTIAGDLNVSGTITAPFFNGLAKEAITAKSIG